MQIERLRLPVADDDVHALATMLVEAVASGAAVSFVLPFDLEAAIIWWCDTLVDADETVICLVAREGGVIVGTVQVHPAWAPNQPHRAEVVKLLVRQDGQGRGVAARLMAAAEAAAREAGYRLLTLDARSGGTAERLYLRLGWTRVGSIPRYAIDPDGKAFHDAVIFFKEL